MNNWNELNSYAQAKVEARRHEADEWRLAQLTQGNAQRSGTVAERTADLLRSWYALSSMKVMKCLNISIATARKGKPAKISGNHS